MFSCKRNNSSNDGTVASWKNREKYVNITTNFPNKNKILNCLFHAVLKAGVVSQAKGSAYIEVGATKMIVSVFDPREIPKQNKYS